MPLRAKFGVLLSILSLIVLLALAVAWWSVNTMEREVRGHLRTLSTTLTALAEVKSRVETQSRALLGESASGLAPVAAGSPSAAGDDPRPIDHAQIAREIEAALHTVENADWVLSQTGKTTLSNLRTRAADWRLTTARLAAGDPRPAPDPAARRAALDLHDLIERIERRLVHETDLAIGYGADVRHRLLIVLAAALLAASLACGLGYALLRRWVIGPVADLRVAAARIGAGDFEHRLPVEDTRARDELERLSVEINHMAALVKRTQDERVDRERLAALGEMIRRLAHNLRNPLGGIRGLAELTRTESRQMGPPGRDIAEAQDRIIQAVDRFERWLSDLLNVTRPAAIQPEPSETRAWLTGLVDAHRPMALARGVGLDLDTRVTPELATFDPRHLEHALSAILSNAIEATSGRVFVLSRTTTPDLVGGLATWEVSIADTGPGVAPDLHEQIFKPYFTTKRDGNGIGLAQALQVVRAHGGTIRVESPEFDPDSGVQPTGAVFVVQIPLHAEPTGQREPRELARIGQ